MPDQNPERDPKALPLCSIPGTPFLFPAWEGESIAVSVPPIAEWVFPTFAVCLDFIQAGREIRPEIFCCGIVTPMQTIAGTWIPCKIEFAESPDREKIE